MLSRLFRVLSAPLPLSGVQSGFQPHAPHMSASVGDGRPTLLSIPCIDFNSGQRRYDNPTAPSTTGKMHGVLLPGYCTYFLRTPVRSRRYSVKERSDKLFPKHQIRKTTIRTATKGGRYNKMAVNVRKYSMYKQRKATANEDSNGTRGHDPAAAVVGRPVLLVLAFAGSGRLGRRRRLLQIPYHRSPSETM